MIHPKFILPIYRTRVALSRDVRNIRQNSGIAKKTNHAEVVQGRPKSTSGKCETNLHGCLYRRAIRPLTVAPASST
jgi:hypothetical protein